MKTKTGGREKGTKNISTGLAGGARKGAGRKSNEERCQINKEKERKKELQNEYKRQSKERQKSIDRQRRERLQQRKDEAVETLKQLSASMQDNNDDGVNEESGDHDDNYEKIHDYDTDDESNGNGDAVTVERRKQFRRSYMPPDNSIIGQVLKKFQETFNASKQAKLLHYNTKMWYEPNESAGCSTGICTKPDDWYRSSLYKFVWRPMSQFGKLVDINQINCIYGCESGHLRLSSLKWRPMFYFEKIVWVLHHRIHCKKCGRTFASIDPRFLAKLPTRVTERFPFVTTSGGPGMHQSMIFQFTNLVKKGIIYRTYVNDINQQQRIRYDMDHINYYDTVADMMGAVEECDRELPAIEVFSEFNSPGNYNGIKLTVDLMKTCVRNFILAREKYYQASFQMHCDDGAAADHTHKLAKFIKANGRRGRVFTASYTVMSKLGLILMNRLTMTKSTFELEGLLTEHKAIRDSQNSPPLRIFQSDNLNHDGRLWNRIFKQELSKDVVPYKKQDSTLPTAGIAVSSFEHLTTVGGMDRIALALMAKFSNPAKKVVYGFDTEWNRDDQIIRMIIISFPGEQIKLCNLSIAGIFSASQFPKQLRHLLQSRHLIPTGRLVGGDCSRMLSYEVRMTQYIELRGLALKQCPDIPCTSLQYLSEHYLHCTLDKHGQCADYSQNPLPLNLQKYAAIDGLVSGMIHSEICSKLYCGYHASAITESDGLKEGSEVDLFLCGSIVAQAKVLYIGKRNCEVTEKWGKTTIVPGKAKVELLHVNIPNIHPPLSFKHESGVKELSWDRKNITLGDIIETINPPVIVVNTVSLVMPVDNDTNKKDESEISLINEDGTSIKVGDCFDQNEDVGDMKNEKSDVDMINISDSTICKQNDQNGSDADIAQLLYEQYDDNDDDDSAPRNRGKVDVFHRFQDFPLGLRCEYRSIISRMIIHATFIFDKDDYCQIKIHLIEIIPWMAEDQSELATDLHLMNHFYHNREWWRRRCKMYTPKAIDHLEKIKCIVTVIKEDPTLKENCWNDDMANYFKSFEEAILNGEFEELPDVYMFTKVGTDTHGLPLYIRHRGTGRTENLHQKMKTALGPWNLGAETAHMLLLLVCYEYNVKSMIRRCGGYDFGHSELHLIDRLQIRIREIFNVHMFPGHKNVLEFKADDKFVSVGIGPLCYNNEYVEIGKPASHFKGDMKFIAVRMGLKYPLMHMGSQDEIKIFTNFMTDHAPTEANFRKLAKIFRQRADGITIFPKLPSMLKAYYKRWEQNRKIKVAQNAVTRNVKALLQRLWQSSISVKDVYIKNTIEVADNKSESNNVLVATKEEGKENVVAKYVPPIQAPTQKEYIPTTPSNQESRRCAWYPMCNEMAKVCNGWHLNTCIYRAKWKFIINPETLTEMKKVEKNTRDRKRKAEKRAEAKMQKKIRKEEHQLEKNKRGLKRNEPTSLHQNNNMQKKIKLEKMESQNEVNSSTNTAFAKVKEEKKQKVHQYQQQQEIEPMSHTLGTLPDNSLEHSDCNVVTKYLYGSNTDDRIVCIVNNNEVQQRDIVRLQPAKSKHQYLNDNIMNAYLSLLQRENDHKCEQESGHLKSIIYETHFFSKLFDVGATEVFKYENVSRWWKKVDIFSLNKLFFPVHIKQGDYEHWTLAVVSIQSRTIDYYDSCGGNGRFWVDGLLDYIEFKWKDQNQGISFNREEWTLNYSSYDVPQQKNNWDCGVFVCLFTYLLLQEKELLFTQLQVNQHVRAKIALSLLKAKLIK